jgi:hypothetical protein
MGPRLERHRQALRVARSGRDGVEQRRSEPRRRLGRRAAVLSRAARIGYAAKSVVLARRRDGHFAPAWARYTGNVATNIVEEAWLPRSTTGPGNIAVRSTTGLLGRFAGNLFEEFWPDVKKLLRR